MLERLTGFAIEQGFFVIQSLGQLPKSCCAGAETEVIDFDKTKEKISELASLNQPKSADALKILPHLNRLDFIELKGLATFIRLYKPTADIDQKVNNQLARFDLQRKIKDSLFVFNCLVNNNKFSCSKAERVQYDQVAKHYLVVVDIDLQQNPIADRLATLKFLSEDPCNISTKISVALRETVDGLPSSVLENLQKPELLSCSKLDAYYARLSVVRL
jgi:hypothetical protein